MADFGNDYILITAIIRFVIFFILHIIWFRIRGNKNPISALILCFFLTALLTSVFIESIYQNLISFLFYLFIFVAYVLGIFGMVLASLRVRILSLIVSKSEMGIDYTGILEIYNRDRIVRNRLLRLKDSGEVKLKKNKYYIKRKFSLYELHGLIFDLMKIIYGFK